MVVQLVKRREVPIKKALVTGGAGFIGSHLCEALLARGFSVVALDDLSTGLLENVRPFLRHPKFRFHKISILDRRKLKPFISGCDVIYHMAAAVGVRLILEKPVRSILTNLDGTSAVLDLAAAHRKKVIIASSSEVYGKSLTRKPMNEEDDRVMGPTSVPRWSYADAKTMDEYLALAYSKEMGLPVVVVRFFNVIGPRQRGHYGMVFPRFIQKALAGRPIPVYGSGAQVRSFTYVKDAVRATIDLSLSKKAEGIVFNVGNNQPITIKKLAVEIKRRIGSSSRIVRAPYKKFYGDHFEDTMFRLPDITRLQKAIRYKPAYDLNQAIDETISYFKHEKRERKG